MLLHFVTRTNDQIYWWSNQKHLKSPNCKLCQKKEDIYIYITCILTAKWIKKFAIISKNIINIWYKKNTHLYSSMFLGYLGLKFTYTLFSQQSINFSQVKMRFLTSTHIHIFLHFLIKKPHKSRYTRREPTHFSMIA